MSATPEPIEPIEPQSDLGGVPVTVVMITRDRRREAQRAVERLLALPERPSVIVVDNASGDDTVEAMSRYGDRVTVVALRRNAGAAGRNVGVRAASTAHVAFADDDSAWAPGALRTAVRVLDRHPRVALVAARVLVGEQRQVDSACVSMANSPLASTGPLPGQPVLGFIACGAVVRRDAFLAAGGFDERYGVGGEEAALAIDLAVDGWNLVYVPEVVALHWPSPRRDPSARRKVLIRNQLWLAWGRRRWPAALATTVRCLWRAATDPDVRSGCVDAVHDLRAVVRSRRSVDRRLERQLRLLD
jgi:GT2 family glycosyltransferase